MGGPARADEELVVGGSDCAAEGSGRERGDTAVAVLSDKEHASFAVGLWAGVSVADDEVLSYA